jgi:putative transcriptional regulator
MRKDHFEKLVASIKEAGEIKAGRKAPSRMYEIKPPEIKTVLKRNPWRWEYPIKPSFQA